MNAPGPSHDTPIAEYLRNIALSDIRDGYVAPSPGVKERLEWEIQKRTNCSPALLVREHVAGRTKCMERKFISADPVTFTDDTLAGIESISAALKKLGATHFEIAFHNTVSGPNEWGDQVVVAVRYVSQRHED